MRVSALGLSIAHSNQPSSAADRETIDPASVAAETLAPGQVHRQEIASPPTGDANNAAVSEEISRSQLVSALDSVPLNDTAADTRYVETIGPNQVATGLATSSNDSAEPSSPATARSATSGYDVTLPPTSASRVASDTSESAFTHDGQPLDTNDNQATFDFSVDASASSQPSSHDTGPTLPKNVAGYEIKKILGRGGMGIVYKARQRKLKRDVALKMVLAGAHATGDQLARFIAEAQAVGHLQHPNIVQIFEVGEHEGLPFFSLEFVDGDSLDRVLGGKPIPAEQAARLMETIARAMQYAHDNQILHRDLKPANVLMTKDGTPKVTDFGLAKRLEDADESASTRTGTVMGTPSYMSPEQAKGMVHDLGPATDQYSLGAMLYEFLTGRPPFMAAKAIETILKVVREEPVPPRQLQSKLPVDLETICLKALQKEPDKRYASCAAMADDLARFLRGEPIQARPIGRAERAWRWCKRNPLVASLSAAAVASLLAVAVVSSWAAIAMARKNEQLATANSSLNAAIDDLAVANDSLRSTNQALEESNEEKLRRSQRLEKFVQEIFTEVNKLNLIENPRAKDFKQATLQKTLPLIDEISRELPEQGSQAIATKLSAVYELSKVYRDLGMGAEAEKALLSVLDLARQRVQIQAGSDASRNNLCLFLQELSNLRLEVNRDFPASREAILEACATAHELVDHSKASPDGKGVHPLIRRQLILADMENTLAINYFRSGDSLSAAKHMEIALTQRQASLKSIEDGSAFKDWPESLPKWKEQEIASNRKQIGQSIETLEMALATARFRAGQSEGVEDVYRKVLAAAQASLKADPDSPTVIRSFVGTAGVVGEYLGQTQRVDNALILLEQASREAERMLNTNSESTALQRAAATAYYRYAQWLDKAKKTHDAQEWGMRALELRDKMLAAEPNNDRCKMDLMLTQGRFGTLENAEKDADALLAKASKDSEMLVQIAQSLAQAGQRSQGETRDRLLGKAVAALKTAVDIGFRDHLTLKREVDLEPLASHPDFIAMIDQMQK